MATLTEMKNDVLRQPENITAILERVARDYRKDVDDATWKVNKHLQNNLTELVQEFGHKAVKAAVDAIEDDDLRTDLGPDTSLCDALDYVLESMPDEALQDS
jgi:methyltransferase-like protein